MSEIRPQATTAKDELAGEIGLEIMEVVVDLTGGYKPDGERDHNRIEKGARAILALLKPRTVNSADELDALKPGTVLRFPDGEIGMIMVTHDKRHVIGYPGILPTAELADASQHCFGDGITVLFTPGDAG